MGIRTASSFPLLLQDIFVGRMSFFICFLFMYLPSSCVALLTWDLRSPNSLLNHTGKGHKNTRKLRFPSSYAVPDSRGVFLSLFLVLGFPWVSINIYRLMYTHRYIHTYIHAYTLVPPFLNPTLSSS